MNKALSNLLKFLLLVIVFAAIIFAAKSIMEGIEKRKMLEDQVEAITAEEAGKKAGEVVKAAREEAASFMKAYKESSEPDSVKIE